MPDSRAFEASTGLGRAIGFDHLVGRLFVQSAQRMIAELPEDYTQVNLPAGGPYDQFPQAESYPLSDGGARVEYKRSSRFSRDIVEELVLTQLEPGTSRVIQAGTFIDSHIGKRLKDSPHLLKVKSEYHGINLDNPRANKIPALFAIRTLIMLKSAVSLLGDSKTEDVEV